MGYVVGFVKRFELGEEWNDRDIFVCLGVREGWKVARLCLIFYISNASEKILICEGVFSVIHYKKDDK